MIVPESNNLHVNFKTNITYHIVDSKMFLSGVNSQNVISASKFGTLQFTFLQESEHWDLDGIWVPLVHSAIRPN